MPNRDNTHLLHELDELVKNTRGIIPKQVIADAARVIRSQDRRLKSAERAEKVGLND